MSQPPPPGPWGPPPPQQPGGWQQPGNQPQWGPQQSWPGQSPKKSGPLKWVLGAVALVAVIAVTAVVSVSLAGDNGNGATGPTSTSETASGAASEFASANDTGPVSVITEDPSCAPWGPVINTLAEREATIGWTERDPSIAADVWSPQVRDRYLKFAQAMREAADQAEPLVRLATHRVMRELYQQFIAFGRAFVDRVPTYSAPDNELVLTANSASTALVNVCSAILFGSAAARAPLTPALSSSPNSVSVGEAGEPARFMESPDPICGDLVGTIDKFNEDPAVVTWFDTVDVETPAGQWSPQQQAASEAVIPLLQSSADAFERLGEDSSNPVLQDFAMLGAVYRRAFAAAIPTYTKADQYLYDTGRYAPSVIRGACVAAGGG